MLLELWPFTVLGHLGGAHLIKFLTTEMKCCRSYALCNFRLFNVVALLCIA